MIGNPPYLFLSGKGSPIRRLLNEGKEEQARQLQDLLDRYGKQYPEVSQGCRDFYKWFYKLAFDICKVNGVLSYITPDTFFTMPKYLDLRNLIFKHSVISMIDLGFSVFDAPTVSSAICVIHKNNHQTESVVLSDIRPTLTKNNRDRLRNIIEELARTVEVSCNEICAYKHPIAKKLYNSVEMTDLGVVLAISEGEHEIQINESCLSNKEKPGFIPVLLDFQMRRNGFVPKAYLRSELNSLNSLHKGDRCLIRKTGDTIVASIPQDKSYAVAHQNVYVAKDKFGLPMKFWMAILNSSMMSFLYQYGLYGQKGRTMAQFRIYALNALPVPFSIPQKMVAKILDMVNEILLDANDQRRNKLEFLIDDVVYQWYGLDKSEIHTINDLMHNL